MDIASFDESAHDIDRVAGLILAADDRNAAPGSPQGSLKIIKNLIRAGNNFLGREHISLALDEGEIAGLVIGYTGRGHDELGTLLRLLLSLRLGELASYFTVVSKMLHGEYTPDVAPDEYYISFIVVDEGKRGKGVGSFLLRHAIEAAKAGGCRAILLDVDRGNAAARALYGKFGFEPSDRSTFPGPHPGPRRTVTLELRLA
ncbi:MAG: GNAT family N-acetyltransferase [Candidatus Dadabacteria bacterium]|nr:GNAT family N-acetyltransferase [Candidatus Dadabacteria bacterium]